MSENLRCPDCGVEAATSPVPGRPDLVAVTIMEDMGCRAWRAISPIRCDVCTTVMRVVVKCPFCEGSGRRFERVGDTLLRPPCLTCETTGELLWPQGVIEVLEE